MMEVEEPFFSPSNSVPGKLPNKNDCPPDTAAGRAERDSIQHEY